MVMEEPEIEKPTTKEDSDFKPIQEKLDKERTDNYTNQFDKMCHSPEWTLNGYTLHYRVQSFERIEARKILEQEEIDEKKDWRKYAANYFERAKLLCKEGEMTEEVFKEVDFYELENLVAAWGVRSTRGFPKD